MAVLKVYNGASWDTPNSKVYNGASWADPVMKYYSGTAWVPLDAATGVSVSALANGDFNSNLGPPESFCRTGVQFNSNGNEYECTATGSFSQNVNTWLVSGLASQVWVEFIRTGGNKTSWSSGQANNTRYSLSTSRTFYVEDFPAGFASTITGYFRFHDAATGGNVLQTTSGATWNAWCENNSCPLCCFTPDTLVTMANGFDMQIGSIREGDMVMTPEGPERVAEVITRVNRPMYFLQFDDDSHLKISSDHPIHVVGKGPAAINCPVDYKDLGLPAPLIAGDYAVDRFGNHRKLVFIATLEYPGTVYTLGNKAFYANGKLVY